MSAGSTLVRRMLRTSLNPGTFAKAFSSSPCRNEHFLNVDTDGFERAVSKERSEGRVVLVDFYAEWCTPCKMLSPILEKLTRDGSVKSGTSDRVLDLVTVDTDAQVQLAGKYDIRSLPTVLAFRDGEQIAKFVGFAREPEVRNFLEIL